MNRSPLLLGLALCVGCGDSSSGGPPSGLVVEVAAERTFVPHRTGSTGRSSSIAGNGRDAFLAWVQVGDLHTELVAQRFDSSLDEVDERESIASPIDGRLEEPTICISRGRLSAAWSGAASISSLPEGVTNDTGYVETSLDPNDAALLRVQDDLIGEETVPALACASNGRRAMTWWHRCMAVDKLDDVYFDFFEPVECAGEPSEGSYMQVFENDGTSVSTPTKIADSDQGYVAAIAAAGSDQFIVITPASIQVRNGSGELIDQTPIGGELYERQSSVACSSTRCAAAFGHGTVELWIFDANDLEHALKFIIVEREEVAPDEDRYGASPHVACDEGSGCLLTWVRMHGVYVDEFFGYDESLAINARAFDLMDGRMGDDEEIAAGEDLDDGALIASVGSGSFLAARLSISGNTLQNLRVE